MVPHAEQHEASLALKGLRTAKLSPRSWAPGRSGDVVSYTQIRLRPRRPWGLRTARLSPLSWAAGGYGGVTSYADQNEASPSLGAANCETVDTFFCFRGAHWRDFLRGSE